TGLGGGVLMLPLLLKIYRFEQKKAVATSLVVIGFSSLASFLIQISKGTHLKIDLSFIGLFIGISITSYLLKLLMERLPKKTSSNLRKIVFTLVVGLSLAKIFS
ncbi:MAG TPA: sulfite exporter TauE/SafE family protein, partial [Bacteriovoracaceae bacterium]|nr:sulfite exporter TauE/SafE family protein [Bacteriovoracaceae bacterium]